MISAGTYRHRVTIQSCDTSEDELGQPQRQWGDVLTNVSALVEDLTGRELLAAQEVHSTVNVRIRMRYRPGVTSSMRVLCRGDSYNIEAVLRIDAVGVEMHLLCSTGLVE
jgi:SPP1 family predicted phage head-tail adaptor